MSTAQLTTNHTPAPVEPAEAPADTTAITEPGLYDGMSDETYHGDPVPGGSLSSTGARKLLPPSCPAKFAYWREHGQEHKATFDFGKAAHRLVLGVGSELREIPAEYLASNGAASTKDAREFIAVARADGAVPLKSEDYQQVQDMADAIRQHPIAGALLDPASGRPEQSAFWRDPVTGIWCRCRFDWLPTAVDGRRMILTDYKTTASAAPDDIRRSIHTFGYHQQAAHYVDGAMELRLCQGEPAFVFIFQEKTAPYLVTVTQLTGDALMWGGVLNAKARDTYAVCERTGHWPGYAEDVLTIGLPPWAERAYDEARQLGHYDLSTDHAEGIR